MELQREIQIAQLSVMRRHNSNGAKYQENSGIMLLNN